MSLPRPEDFRYRQPVEVRFRDIDAAGHAHHTLPLVYWEEVRARYWAEVAGHDPVIVDYVLGEVTLRFHHRIHYPATLMAGVRVTRLGRSSFDMAYGLWDADDLLLSSGESTQVLYDFQADRPVRIDDETRARIEAFEALSPHR